MKTLWVLLACAATLSCVHGANANSDVDTIQSLRMKSNEAIARHDAEAVGSFLAEDFVATISSGSIQPGRQEHVDSFAEHFEQFSDVIYVRTPTTITLSNAAPHAIEHGTWEGSRTTANGKLENGGEYTAAWRKTDSGWKIYSELYVALYCRGVDC